MAGYYACGTFIDSVTWQRYILFHVTFSFPNDNFSKYQWIFTKLAMCIDIVATCFGKANCQISSIFDGVIHPGYDNSGVLLFYVFI